MLRVDVLTIFPELVRHYAAGSILGRAADRGVWELRTHDVRDAADDPHRRVDDTPYGGGAGMVMTPGPIIRTIRSVPDLPRPLIALTPSGRHFDQGVARELALLDGFSLLCGRYEGMDQRALRHADDELSVGDFVLAGGELAALTVLETVVRLRPGALGNEDSVVDESFSSSLLEYPHYTKPAEFEGHSVPAVLLSGDHGRVERWRRAQALHRTRSRRPDLWDRRGPLSPEEQQLLDEFPADEPHASKG